MSDRPPTRDELIEAGHRNITDGFQEEFGRRLAATSDQQIMLFYKEATAHIGGVARSVTPSDLRALYAEEVAMRIFDGDRREP